ncbi:kunitz-type protease inhibitor 3 [Vicugna pacos]|uniref:Kunitz-type protease inhibitor 3 n=1 Tax=Vicugna pacos TaxID=30538 RepID=A0ABM5BTB8_VICPA
MQLWVSPSLFLLLLLCQELRSELRPGKPVTRNVCKLPMEIGLCRGLVLRWFYNWKTYECELFSYGGCNGNDNNFMDKEVCEKACKDT